MANPRFPVYIVSRGRADRQITAKALDDAGVPFRVIVEADEHDAYAAVVGADRLLVLDEGHRAGYDPCDQLGMAKPLGPGPARNLAWDHAQAAGYSWHWVMDDNIRAFYRLQHGKRLYATTGTIFRAMETFVLRYTNVAIAGPAYVMFAPETQRLPPFQTNTRIYSCLLIRGDLPYRWRGRYNEDTDLSLRALKDGWVTVQFYAFLQQKMWTRVPGQRGGNTDAFYHSEGTLPKSRMLARLHPDVVRLTWRYNRWHHHADYRRFRQRLKFAPGVVVPEGTDEMGMVLERTPGQEPPRSPLIQGILARARAAPEPGRNHPDRGSGAASPP